MHWGAALDQPEVLQQPPSETLHALEMATSSLVGRFLLAVINLT